ncbi:phage tail protein [Dissulfurirhabdus thermomarina]|uniref:Phage tail protein n=1 Tax=Dissulfurirhabdus thermomarina TaxID=1765737 RepID=A0A6N9TJ21_DISTH|nr:phage tail sheath subtilisin-like domain-containing protein [Dissulfurirhabdus thermomarina]NDY41251.1 phage tail protein [Dissulfurirhabdus thermomarina]
MAISFNSIPVNLRTPGVYVEFDNSQAVRGLPGMPYRALLVGQRLAGGTVAELVPTRVSSADQARDYFGQGSMLAQMAAAWFAHNRSTETWAIALDDNPAGVAATGTLTVTGTATEAGTLNLYVGGGRVQVAVASGDSQDAVAAAIASAIGAAADLPASAAVDGVNTNQVNLTARHKGEAGNDIDLRVSYYQGEQVPAGLTVAVGAMSGGSGNPDLSGLITAMGDEWYNVIVLPYTDAASLTAMETELEDRWGPMRAIEGHAFAAAAGTQAAMSALGDSRNSPHVSIVATGGSPTLTWSYAAAVAAVVAYHANIDPARPFQTLPLAGVLAPAEADRFTQQERNLLLYDGISTTVVDAGGRVLIERLITTYTQNAFGTEDPSYLDVNTLLTLGYLRYSFRARFAQKYPRHKLADDGTRFGAGQAILTPKIAKAECFALFRQWEDAGLVENFDDFKANIIVERNATDPNRLDFVLPPDLINQLRVTAAQIAFRL